MSNLHLNIIGSGEPLILLHGWGWHSGIWTPLIPHLSEKFQLFIPDLPGFGKSPCLPSDYSFYNLANLLFDYTPDSATWLGWSLGGMLAWYIAMHHPKKIKKLITVAASPKFVCDESWPGVPLSVLQRFSTQLNQHYDATILDFLRLQLRGSPDNEIVFENLKKQLLPIDQKALIGGLNLLKEADFRADLSHITIPSLHIFGEMDALVPAAVMQPIQSLTTGRYELIKRAGHIPFLSHQNEFINLVTTCMIDKDR